RSSFVSQFIRRLPVNGSAAQRGFPPVSRVVGLLYHVWAGHSTAGRVFHSFHRVFHRFCWKREEFSAAFPLFPPSFQHLGFPPVYTKGKVILFLRRRAPALPGSGTKNLRAGPQVSTGFENPENLPDSRVFRFGIAPARLFNIRGRSASFFALWKTFRNFHILPMGL